MAKLGLLARALAGAVGGAAQANLDQFEEEGQDKRARALIDYKQKFALEIEAIRSNNNLMAVQIRQTGANTRQAETIGLQEEQLRLTAEGAESTKEFQAEQRAQDAEIRIADLLAQGNRDAATAEYREEVKRLEGDRVALQIAATEARTQQEEQQFDAQMRRLDEIQAKLDRQFGKDVEKIEKDKVVNTIENLDGSTRLIFESGKVKDVPKAGTGPGGMTRQESDDQAQTDYNEINPIGPDVLRADPYGGLDEETWVERRSEELFSGVEATSLTQAQPPPTAASAIPVGRGRAGAGNRLPPTQPTAAIPVGRGRAGAGNRLSPTQPTGVAKSVGKAARPNGDPLPDGITRTIDGTTYIVIGGQWYAQ